MFSCGLSPTNTAAAYKAIELFSNDPSKIDKLHENAAYILKSVRELGYHTGLSEGTSIVPVIIGNSQRTVYISNELYKRGINALPIIYPAVKEDEARIRFFMSADHTRENLDKARGWSGITYGGRKKDLFQCMAETKIGRTKTPVYRK